MRCCPNTLPLCNDVNAKSMKKVLFFLAMLITGTAIPVDAQYFGRNKPRYRSFDFKLKQTDHFDVYYYLKNEEAMDRVAKMTEQWYDLHQQITRDTFYHKNPILFYNNHAEFQQTNAISGGIGVGTGGVTEGFKNRVVMPLTMTNQQTWQVLGHELVHAFQFHMVINGDSTSIRNMGNLPLWIVEGMAEYMSMGRVDPFTAMWMRDAVLNDDVPSFKKMASPKYFPYRYGQAAWSYLTGVYGDGVIEPLFSETAKFGLESAFPRVLDAQMNTISEGWESTLKDHFGKYLGNKKERVKGKKLISDENSGRINVSPSLSPNGRYVIFLSEKDLFSTDLFLADARSGKILNKVASTIKDTDLDALNALESTVTWSPNSQDFAFIAFKKGQNVLVIKEALTGKTKETIKVKGVPALANPVWSPDGKEIVLVGMIEGQPDLFALNLKSKKVRQLTDDIYSEIQPSFSEDGSQLLFSYDKKSVDNGRSNGRYTFDLAIMDYASGAIQTLDIFHTAQNLNPNFDHEGNIYFISDRDGFRNLYRYDQDSSQVLQMTDILTGISGISRFSPAITASRKRDRVIYTHYNDHTYTLYQAASKQLLNKVVDPGDVDFTAGTLPIAGNDQLNIVNRNLNNIDQIAYDSPDSFKKKKIKSKLKLDYLGGGVGVGTGNSVFGNNVVSAGSIDMLFSDILGNNQLYSSIRANGEIYDFGGQAFWINRKHKLAYGAGFSHIPQTFGGLTSSRLEEVDIGNGQIATLGVNRYDITRIFEDQVTGFVHYPFSTTLRLEGGLGLGLRYFRKDELVQFIDPNTGFLLGEDRNRAEIGDILNVANLYFIEKGFSGNANIGLVGDNSFMGLTSPLAGHRFRLDFGRSFGTDKYWSINGDFRKYFWFKPVSIALRGNAIIRYSNDETNNVVPIYLGQMGILHGFDFFFNDTFNSNRGVNPNNLLGQKTFITNLEFRVPFTGPKQLSLIGSKAFLSDLNFFLDAGVAFDEFSNAFDDQIAPIVATAGLGLRINLFGAMIVEPYYAFNIKNAGKNTFGINIVPGW